MRSIIFSSLVAGATALNNGVGKLPKMGYNSKFGSEFAPEMLTEDLNSFQCLRLQLQ